MEYTHNSDLTHYEKCRWETNCGSYALRLNEWYIFDSFEEGEEYYWIRDLFSNGYNDEEISNIYAEILVDELINDFKDTLIPVTNARPPETKDEELIAFAAYCTYDYYYDYINWDFHFRVYRDGGWKEKCGCEKVKDCDIIDWGNYISNVFYFIHKI